MSTEKDREAIDKLLAEKYNLDTLWVHGELENMRDLVAFVIQHGRQGERGRMCKLIEFAFFEWATNGQICKARTTEGLLDEFLEQEESK